MARMGQGTRRMPSGLFFAHIYDKGYKDGLKPESLADGNWLVKQNQPVSKIETKSDTNLRSLYESWFRNALISKSVILWWQVKKEINSELEGANTRSLKHSFKKVSVSHAQLAHFSTLAKENIWQICMNIKILGYWSIWNDCKDAMVAVHWSAGWINHVLEYSSWFLLESTVNQNQSQINHSCLVAGWINCVVESNRPLACHFPQYEPNSREVKTFEDSELKASRAVLLRARSRGEKSTAPLHRLIQKFGNGVRQADQSEYRGWRDTLFRNITL